MRFEEFKDEVEDIIEDLERDNAIRLLPEPEKTVIQLVESIDKEMANQSENMGDYLLLNRIATPGERAARKLGMSTEEVIEILLSAVEQIYQLLDSKE